MRSYDAKYDARVTHTEVVRHGRGKIQSINDKSGMVIEYNIRGRLSLGCKCKKMDLQKAGHGAVK